jgi:hypothetical protein
MTNASAASSGERGAVPRTTATMMANKPVQEIRTMGVSLTGGEELLNRRE